MERRHSSDSSGGSLMPGLGSAGPQRWTSHADAASHWAMSSAAAFLEPAAGPAPAEVASLMTRDLFSGAPHSAQHVAWTELHSFCTGTHSQHWEWFPQHDVSACVHCESGSRGGYTHVAFFPRCIGVLTAGTTQLQAGTGWGRRFGSLHPL